MKIALSTESTVDLPKELLERIGVHVARYSVILGDTEYKDGDISTEEMYEYADKYKKLPKTSAINPAEFDVYFEELLKDYDAVIHISLSSEITSTTRNAMDSASRASKPVYVIDSRSLSTGMALLCFYARDLIDAGYEPKEIYDLVQARVPAVQASFVIETLEYLKMGGRCSAIKAMAAGLLGLKPEIIVKNGAMIAGAKHRGPMKKVVLEYVEDTLRKFNNPDKKRIFITYSTAPDDVIAAVRERLEKENFEEIMVTKAGGTIGTHCGPHTLGILYFNDGDHPIEHK